MKRVAEPESEKELLELARCLPVAELEKTLRGWNPSMLPGPASVG